MSILLKHSIAAILMCTALASSTFASARVTPEEACRVYLSTQTSVTTMGGNTYDLSKEDAHGAFLMATGSIQHGVSAHLLGALQEDESAGSGVKRVGKKLGDLLKSGTPLESVTAAQVLGAGDKIDFFKGALNYVINTFLWDKTQGKTTEVTAPEVASAFCVRTRLIDFKKSLG